MYRNEVPFLRMLLPFIAGVLIQLVFNIPLPVPGMVCVAGFLLLMIHTVFKKFSSSWKLRSIGGICLNLAFIAAGMSVTYLKTGSNNPNHFMYRDSEPATYLAKITRPLVEKPGSFKTIAEIFVKVNGNGWQHVSGLVLVYLQKDSVASVLNYGDVICFSSGPARIPSPGNPAEFDYRRFMSFHQVYHQVYLGSQKWMLVSRDNGNPVIAAAYKVRNLFISIMRTQFDDKRSFAVASALVAGYDDEVDQELMHAYSSSGAMHILSVSGMHVALIYQGLNLLLGFMKKKKWSRQLLYAFLISFIWFYAYLTGFAPSVARSAVMLSVVIIARWHGGNANVFNTLLVTVFALLIYNPYYIADVGFQLSFLAVWGIIYLHPKIFMLLEPPNRMLHWIWEISAVSLAAQIMTFPLGLFYFHQFPNLFLITNLVVIPLSGFIIYMCIAVLVFSPVAVLSDAISAFTGWLLYFLNECVLVVDRLPGAVTSGIYISPAETICIYILMTVIFFFLITRKALYFIQSLLILSCLLTSQLYEKSVQVKAKHLVVYNIPRGHAVELVSGQQQLLIADSLVLKNKTAQMFHMSNFRGESGVTNETSVAREFISGEPRNGFPGIIYSRHFIFFEGKKIIIADEQVTRICSLYKLSSGSRLKIDYLIITGNGSKGVKDLARIFDCTKFIIDSSNTKYRAEKLLEEGRSMGIFCHSVIHQGAFAESF